VALRLAAQPVAASVKTPAVLAAAALAVSLGCGAPAPSRVSRPNVALITVDSLRADRIDYTPGGRTPAIAALAARGVRFDRAFTVTPWTAPALVSIFTGLYPPTHGVVHRDDTTPRKLPTLPRILGSLGYTLRNYGFFTAVSYYRNLGLPEQAITGAEVIGSQALSEWLPVAKEPFFAWVHDVEPHMPYGASGYEAAEAKVKGSSGLEHAQVAATLPVGAGYNFEPGDREKLLALYDEDVSRMDSQIGRVLAALDKYRLARRTIIVFTADHGEELLDHGWVGHASTSGEAKLTDEVLHIPLVIAGPGVPPGRETNALAENVDVAPTILDLVGIHQPEGMQGVSIVPTFAGLQVRRRVFFDTTPGGHLTPEARKLERLQGVGDGVRIHAERVGAARQATDPLAPELAGDLERWRKAQARARIRVLAEYGGAVRPDPREVETWAEALEVDAPRPEARLTFQEATGTIRLAWSGPRREEPPWWIEYKIGSGIFSAAGAFSVEEPEISFGPFPIAFWNDLAGYSPFRFRILDPATKRRSAWRSFSVEKEEP
jgi:choline-sulfatase